MSRFVLGFGSDRPDPVFEAVRGMISSWTSRLFVIPKLSETDMHFEAADIQLTDAFSQLRSGKIVTLLIESLKPNSGKITIHRPHLAGDNFALWYAELDNLPSYEAGHVRHVQSVRGLKFAALCLEDSIDITELKVLDKNSFPWTDWRLVEAVVAEGQGDISTEEVKRGLAFLK